MLSMGVLVLGTAVVVTALKLVWRVRFDTGVILAVYCFVLVVLPSRYVVSAFGSVGSPAMLAGIMFAGWWASKLVLPSPWFDRERQPVRIAVFVFASATAMSYVAAAHRPLDGLEASAADRGMLAVAAAAGVALVAADGLRTRGQLDLVLKCLAVAGGLAAVVGILQFAAGIDLAEPLRLPGLTANTVLDARGFGRSGFDRVPGTAEHPIEFSVVLTMVFPIALHYALTAVGNRARRWWWACTALMLVAIPFSVSRTAVIALLTVLLVLGFAWSPRQRWRAVGFGLVFLVVMRVAVPGLLGTIRALFTSFGEDPSIADRQIDYAFVTDFFSQRPIFGRGFFTFIPTRYDWLDNQYLMSAVETGVVGILALVVVFTIGIGVARLAWTVSEDLATRDLARSLMAALAVPVTTFATFDYMSFSIARGLLFLLLGCAGALWRLEVRDRRREHVPDAAGRPAVPTQA